MHEIKSGQLTAGAVKQNYRGTIDKFVASENSFLFISQVKRTPTCWKQFLFDVFPMIKHVSNIFPYIILCWFRMRRTFLYYKPTE